MFRQLTVSGLLSAWEDFISFAVTGGAEKNTRMWFASEDQWHYATGLLYILRLEDAIKDWKS